MLKVNSLSLIAWLVSAESISHCGQTTRVCHLLRWCSLVAKGRCQLWLGKNIHVDQLTGHSLVESVSWADLIGWRSQHLSAESCSLSADVYVFSLVGTHLTDWISAANNGCDHDQLIRNEAGTDQEPRLESSSFSHLESHCLFFHCIFKQYSCIKEGISIVPLKWSEVHLFKMLEKIERKIFATSAFNSLRSFKTVLHKW
jgi:hypothetical protein